MAETTETMDTSEDIGQDIDATINELSELVKDDAVVGDKESKDDENMDDSTEKKDDEEDAKAEEEEPSEETSGGKKKKKKTVIDKTERPPLVRAIHGDVIIDKFRMRDAKMKDFLTILNKADSFVFEYNTENTHSSQTDDDKQLRFGKLKLTYSAKKDFKAISIINILADLVDFNPEIEITAPESIRTELDAELYGARRSLMSQAKDKTLYVNDITNATTEEFLKALVPDCSKAHIPVDSEGNKRGWAVLEFRNGKEADECMKSVKEIEIGSDNKAVISRAESSDPAVVEKAKETHNNKPLKRKKVGQTPSKDKKRQWNQGPGMQGPRPLMQGNTRSPKGGNKPRPSTAGNYGKQGSYSGNQGNRNRGYGNQGYGRNKGYGNQGYGNQGYGNQGYGDQDWGYQQGYDVQDNYRGGHGGMNDDDNMLDFLQCAIMEMKNKKSANMGGDGWGGSGGGYSSYSQYEGFEDTPKRRRDNWNTPAGGNWGSGARNNQGNRGQQQGLGVWSQAGNQQGNSGRNSGKNYGGAYGGQYNNYGGRY
ncbi:nucleolin-like isoform X2 [Argopecten irradians]|uniref:nucleolin-like isoform X2 n=1 Tax=Argopecten irradians TaxID=31199 RepID=UPI003716F2E0